MAPKLKLNRGSQGEDFRGDQSPRDVLPFPAGGARTRSLVAGRVAKRASRGHDFEPRFNGLPADAEVLSHAELVRDIDHTLDSMQRRLDRLRRDTEPRNPANMKFPNLIDDDRLPPAA